MDGKGDSMEIVKRLKFDHSTKWYMSKPESAGENETHKILWNFEIQTYYLIPARIHFINKKKKPCCLRFCHPAEHCEKMKESEKIDKYLNLGREPKKLGNVWMTLIQTVFGALKKSQRLEIRLEELKISLEASWSSRPQHF